MPAGFRYWAFISYSHADTPWARWLHHALETYPLPKHLVGLRPGTVTVPPRLKPVFRDREELPAAAELGPQLEAALRDSVALVVLCSPAAARSRWVNEEVLHFKRLGRSAAVFPLIVAGSPGDPTEECFPPAVRAIVDASGQLTTGSMEPLAADAHSAKDGRTLALLKIVAGITGLPLDELRQRDQQRRQRRLASLAGFGLGLTAVMSVLAAVAWQQRSAAQASAERARASELVAQQEAVRATAAQQHAEQEAARATKAETVAVKEREATRRALAQSQMALAEAAYQSGELPGMVRALDSVPTHLRDQTWKYLSARRDSSMRELSLSGLRPLSSVVPLPHHPAHFILAAATGEVGIVNVSTQAVRWRFATVFRDKPTVAASHDGRRLAVTQKGATEIRVLSTSNGTREKILPSPTALVRRMIFSPDGRSLALLDHADPQARLWVIDANSGAVLWSQRGVFFDAIFSPDNERLFAGSRNSRKFIVYDAATGDALLSRTGNFSSFALSHDGGIVALGAYAGDLELLDAAKGDVLQRAHLHAGAIEFIGFTAQDHLITVGQEGYFESGRRVLRLWDRQNLAVRGTFFGLKNGRDVETWTYDPDSGFFVSFGATSRLWRITADLEAARISSLAEQGYATAFLNEEELVARKEFRLARYQVREPRAPREIAPLTAHGYTTLAFHLPSGRMVAGTRTVAPPNAMIYDLTRSPPALRHEFRLPTLSMRLDFDPAGARLLCIGLNSSFLLDAQTGERQLQLAGTTRAAFTASGERVIGLVARRRTADDVEDDLVLFDATSGKTGTRVRSQLRLNDMVLSPDRRLVAVAGAEKWVRIYDADTLRPRWSFRAHDAEITALAFHPARPVLLTGSADGAVKLWDYETATLRETILGFDGSPVSAAFSPSARLLAIESQDRHARLFALDDSSRIAIPAPRAAGQ